MRNVLLLGCETLTMRIISKGVDSFTKTEHRVGGGDFLKAMGDHGWRVTHVRSSDISADMPRTVDALLDFDAVVISDVGSNTFYLSPATSNSQLDIDRLDILVNYVKAGGGLLLIGGYLAFSGFEAKARYGATPIAEVLPVDLLASDDRVEAPAGVWPLAVKEDHPILAGVPSSWPPLLGYNRMVLRPQGCEIMRVGADPLLVVGHAGAGRVATFSSEFAPHWATPEFLEWPGYGLLWNNVMEWLAKTQKLHND